MRNFLLGGAAICALALSSCQTTKTTEVAETAAPEPAAPTVSDAAEFLAKAETELAESYEFAAHTEWVQNTYINHDTDWLLSKANAQRTAQRVEIANQTKQFEGLDLPLPMQRKLNIIRADITIPAPSTPGAADELSEITTRLASTYSTGKYEIDGKPLNLDELSTIVEQSRDPAKIKEAWEGWRTVSPAMKDDYVRMVEIANEGARELGFANLAEMWLSNYDMPPAEMEAVVERLWSEVAPLYEQLHCQVRTGLNKQYGGKVQPASGPIRADLLGNMWAQQWNTIYPVVGPKTGGPGYDLTKRLEAKKYDPEKMIRTAEGFFSSLGLAPLPATFWERSQITRPRDREVVCHASAWDITSQDIRIKMCTEVNAEDFVTAHHELGHNYYQRAYGDQDFLFRNGANDGFHEAIGDFIALSITPEYLKQIGLIDKVPSADADIGLLYDRALEKIAFLPFGLMVDKWRWEVFRGEVAPDQYNDAWWALRTQYQGITPPGERPADAFDPGAKYHVPGNTPYLRYFLSFVLQFQFHKAACEQAGWEGPLHRCSIYNNKEVGEKFNAMLEMGASKPWPDALEAFTGTREISAEPLVEYFEPLTVWLKEQNKGQDCGW